MEAPILGHSDLALSHLREPVQPVDLFKTDHNIGKGLLWALAGALWFTTRVQAALWQQQQREPSLDELARTVQCAKEEVLLLHHLQQEMVSLEQPVYSEEIPLGQTLVAPDDSEQREQQTEVAALLKHLSPRERRVLQTRYQRGPTGAYGIEDIPLPYTEVSRQLGMTTGLVKAIETHALLKMRFRATQSSYVPGG